MANKPMLVYTAGNKSGREVGTEVQVGDYVTGLHNSPPEMQYEVTYFRFPSSPASSGKVSIRPVGAAVGVSAWEVYVSLIGAEWINRTDRG